MTFHFAVSDVSPIIIDEENGIVYSPGLRRSDYMAARLREMKEKGENLSPTGIRCRANWFIDKVLQYMTYSSKEIDTCTAVSASQKFESCSPTGLRPSLGSSPTVLKLACKKM